MSPLKQNNDTASFSNSYKFYFLILTVIVAILISILLIVAVHSQSYYSYIGGL